MPGHSRQHRMGSTSSAPSGHPLASLFKSFPTAQCSMVNAYWPHSFEKLEGNHKNKEYESEMASRSFFRYDVIIEQQQVSEFPTPAMARAQAKALEAYSTGDSSPKNTIRLAEEALKIWPGCPDAYNVLALYKATNFDEALAYYQKGVEGGRELLAAFKSEVRGGRVWDCMPLRPYFRSVYGVANTLRKMRRADEALPHYNELIRLDKKWHFGSSYINVYTYMPEAVFRAKGSAACLDFMNTFAGNDDCLSYNSSALPWIGTYALAYLAANPKERFTPYSSNAPGQNIPDFKKGLAPMFFVQIYPNAVDMLLGDMPMPGGSLPRAVGAAESMTAAVQYVYSSRDLWQATPGVMERLRLYRNTWEVYAVIMDLRRGHKAEAEEALRYIKQGMYPDARFKDTSIIWSTPIDQLVEYTRHMAARPTSVMPEDHLKILEALIDAGCDPNSMPPPASLCRIRTVPPKSKGKREGGPAETPLHLTCYRGYGPRVVEALLKGNADPVAFNCMGMIPAEYAANQGNWMELHRLLSLCPKMVDHQVKAELYRGNENMPSERLLECLLAQIIMSSCPACLDGGHQCPRCHPHGDSSPHSPHAHFQRSLSVLVAHGLRPNNALCRWLGLALKQSQCSRDSRTYLALHRHLNTCFLEGVTRHDIEAWIQEEMPEAARPVPEDAPSLHAGFTGFPNWLGSLAISNTSSAIAPIAAPKPAASSASKATAAAAAASLPAPSSEALASRPSSAASSSASAAGTGGGAKPAKACGKCGQPGCELKCGACQQVWYCGAKCQKLHWMAHKPLCKKMRPKK